MGITVDHDVYIDEVLHVDFSQEFTVSVVKHFISLFT